MKKTLIALLLLSVGAMAGCCTNDVVKHPTTKTAFVSSLRADTVALVHRDSDGDIMPYCAGVWVSKDLILSANHCAKAAVEARVKQDLTDLDDEATDDEIDKLIADREKGFEIEYIVARDYTGMWREPKALYTSKVVKFDDVHDLVLLQVTEKAPVHPFATVAVRAPVVGEELSVVGHPSALAWTYTHVMVSAYREKEFKPMEDEKKEGPYMQVAGEVWKGNSGGGAFNQYGQLVGIASFMPPVPNECFFIHVDSIRAFLSLKK